MVLFTVLHKMDDVISANCSSVYPIASIAMCYKIGCFHDLCYVLCIVQHDLCKCIVFVICLYLTQTIVNINSLYRKEMNKKLPRLTLRSLLTMTLYHRGQCVATRRDLLSLECTILE